MSNRNVITDDPSVDVPSVEFWDKYELNRQTAYNRSRVEHAGKCGCFYCGSTFAGSEVIDWLRENDGEDTALCPYCKTDAIIVGNEKFPLSTALLSILYMNWFESEFKERKEAATRIPIYDDCDDYRRKGIPFLYENDENINILGEIKLFGLHSEGAAWGPVMADQPNSEYALENAHHDFGGIVDIVPQPLDDGYFLARFITENGKIYPYEPWSGSEQDLLEDLVGQYGSNLKGLVKDGGFAGKMQLFVERDTRC